jgi:hemoglobin
MSDSLYDKYGGFTVIADIVHAFYDKILDAEELDPYFQGIDMDRLARHQTDFLCHVLGGPVEYEGRALYDAHAPLNITDEHFYLVAGLLEETLEEAGMEDDDIRSVIGVVVNVKDQIVVVE